MRPIYDKNAQQKECVSTRKKKKILKKKKFLIVPQWQVFVWTCLLWKAWTECKTWHSADLTFFQF